MSTSKYDINLKDGASIPPGATILVGCVSYGNVGQLAVDAFLATANNVNTSKTTKIGSIYSEYVYPITGFESFGHEIHDKFLCSSIEIHHVSGEKPLYVLLMRSLCLPGKSTSFANDLVEIIDAWKPKLVLFLTGASTEEVELGYSRNFYYADYASQQELEFVKEIYPNLYENLESLRQLNLPEEYYPQITRPAVLSYIRDEVTSAPYGMIIAKTALSSFKQKKYQNKGIESPVVLGFGKFVGEGDNTHDGLELASLLAHGLEISSTPVPLEKLSVPQSWKVRLYGQSSNSASSMFY